MKRGRSTSTPTKADVIRFEAIPGLPFSYATRDGRIFSDHPNNRWRGKLHELRPHDNGRGYLRVRLHGKARCVHRLVALTFLGPVPDGFEVNHLDGDKHNNAAENLEYTTRAGNMRHAASQGLRRDNHGGAHHNAKLTDEEARSLLVEYLKLARNGRLPDGAAAQLSAKYGVNRDYPRLIATGRCRSSRALA